MKILDFLKEKGPSWIRQIALALFINAVTVRDTLRRLEKSGRVIFIGSDKFQKKIYKVV